MNNRSYFSNKTIFGFYAIILTSLILMPSIECEYCEGDGVIEETTTGYYGEGLTPYVDTYEIECFYCEGSGSVEGELDDDE